jgi:pimeloyl-ACP methyl ester carboxylesterase
MTCAGDTGSTPAMSREIAAEISGADLLIIDGYRHLGLVEDPAGFTAPILDFCERTDR